jgi:hypothetical protein
MSDLAETHKKEILDAAHHVFHEDADSYSAVSRLQESFQNALSDGSAQELCKKLQKTAWGESNVKIHTENGQEVLDISSGFFENATERGANHCLHVILDKQRKTAIVQESQPFHFELPDWVKDLTASFRPPEILRNPSKFNHFP